MKNKDKICTCYNCKNKFRQSKKIGYLILFLIIAVITVAINIIVINLCRDIIKALPFMVIFSIVAVITGLFISPFFVKYVPVGQVIKNENQTVSIEKNNRKIKRSVKNRLRKENSENN
ncbi:MAG: hypothetical protein ACI4Q8_05050 [Ruminococcus sp.]